MAEEHPRKVSTLAHIINRADLRTDDDAPWNLEVAKAFRVRYAGTVRNDEHREARVATQARKTLAL